MSSESEIVPVESNDDYEEESELIINLDEENVSQNIEESTSKQKETGDDDNTDSEAYECDSDMNAGENNSEMDIKDAIGVERHEQLFCFLQRSVANNETTHEARSLRRNSHLSGLEDATQTDEEEFEGEAPDEVNSNCHVMLDPDDTSVVMVSESFRDVAQSIPSLDLPGNSSEIDDDDDQKMTFKEALTDLEDFSDLENDSIYNDSRRSSHRLSVGSTNLNIIQLESDDDYPALNFNTHASPSNLDISVVRDADQYSEISDNPVTDEENFNMDDDMNSTNNPHSKITNERVKGSFFDY